MGKASFRRTVTVLALLLVTGCTRPMANIRELARLPDRDFSLATTADDDARRFQITVRVTSRLPVCFSALDLPNPNGSWTGQEGLFALETGDGIMTLPDENAGVCMGPECVVKVRPGQSISANLNYSEFGAPEEVAALREKTLLYNLRGSRC